MKKILALQIYKKIEKNKLSRILNFLDFHFKQKTEYKKFKTNQNVNCNVLVVLKDTLQRIPNLENSQITQEYFINIDTDRIELKSEKKENLYSFHKANIFNEIQENFNKGFFYFPYGFTYRMTGLGYLNDFGFRIEKEIKKLLKRDKKHKIICIFGGSAAWSIDCLYNEMFSQKLENFLNNDSDLNKKGFQFTCLNFGQSAATIFQSINYYLLFSSELKPEFVICHDGWNDLLYGSYTDHNLINKYKMTYTYELEEWALNINGLSNDLYKKNEIIPYEIKSSPIDIISAYTFRKNQFKKIVESYNGIFVNGLQPKLTDKVTLSKDEKKALDKNLINSQDNWQNVRMNMASMFDKLLDFYNYDKNLVNFKETFSKLSSKSTHFVDNIHLTPSGDEVVAKTYFYFLKGKFIK